MDNKGRKFQLIGFVNPYCALPAFVYPVFAYSNQYYYEDGNDYRINEFIPAGEVLQKEHFCQVKETKCLSVGDETIYAYQTQKDCVMYGNGEMMRAFLTKESHKVVNRLLSKEIDDVLTRIIGHIRQDTQLVRIENGVTKVTIRGLDKITPKHYPESIKAFVQIQNVERGIFVSTKDKDGTFTIEPTKALARGGEITRRNSEVQRYANLVQRYKSLIAEFYILYEDLVKTKQPSLERVHLYDINFYNRFIQILIQQSGVNLREKDILIIYQRLNFKNKQFFLHQDRFRNERVQRVTTKKLIREIEIQMKINSLFYQMIDSSSQDPKEGITQLDIKYLEEV